MSTAPAPALHFLNAQPFAKDGLKSDSNSALQPRSRVEVVA